MVTVADLPQALANITNDDFRKETLLEYIISVAEKLCPDVGIDFNVSWGFRQGATLIFLKRYFQGDIDISFKDSYINNGELQKTLEALGIDPSKFWYLILFLKDYVDDETTGQIIPYTAYNQVELLVDKMYELGFREDELSGEFLGANKVGELSFRVGSGHYQKIDDPNALYAIYCALRSFLRKEKPRREVAEIDGKWEELNAYQVDLLNQHLFTIKVDSDAEPLTMDESFKIKRFADYLLPFLKTFKSNNTDTRISKDKTLLASRIIYIIGYTTDISFNQRRKADGVTNMDRLKNLLKWLKGRDPGQRFFRNIYV